MVELVDALDSKSSEGNLVRVRFPPSVQKPEPKNSCFVIYKKYAMTTYFVYAISSCNKTYIYVGMTNHLQRRLSEHNKGYNKTTKPYAPFNLIYWEELPNRTEARAKEKYLKSGIGKAFLKSLQSS